MTKCSGYTVSNLSTTSAPSPRTRHDCRYIVVVRKFEPRQMRCISVDSPTRQFLAGKSRVPTHTSVSLDIILFLTLWCRDVTEIIVCDPKRTDFTWTPDFPSVIRFAAGAMEIVDAVNYARWRQHQRGKQLRGRTVWCGPCDRYVPGHRAFRCVGWSDHRL